MIIRTFLTAFAFVLWSAQAFASYTITSIGTNGNTSGTTIAVSGVTVAANTQVVVIIAEANASFCNSGPMSDGTNTYSHFFQTAIDSTHHICWWSFFYSSGVSGKTITYTKTASADVTVMNVIAVTGTNGLGLDTESSNGTFGSPTNAPTVGPTSPAVSNEVFIVGTAWVGTATYTQASGFTTPPNLVTAGTGSTAVNLEGGFIVVSGSGAQTYTASLSSSSEWGSLMGSYEPASGGGATVAPFLNLLGVGQ